MASLGIKHYRFSFSWPRLVPSGRAGSPVNEAGVDYYTRLLDRLEARGVAPCATMYHWDLPDCLEAAYGGVACPDCGGGRFAADFAYYARVLFERFGSRVRDWLTFNEPWVVAAMGYGSGDVRVAVVMCVYGCVLGWGVCFGLGWGLG